MVQVPAIRNEAVAPFTVQTLVVSDLNMTVKPELAEALRLSGVPTVCVGMLGKEMVCDIGVPGVPETVAVKFCATLPLSMGPGLVA